MSLGLLSLFGPRRLATKSGTRRLTAPRFSFQPLLEDLEERDVPAAPAALGNLEVLAAPRVHQHLQAFNILPIQINNVVVQEGGLVAIGQLGQTIFDIPLVLSTSPSADPACPILNLELGPIHLDLLGLVVDTSEICLAITAEPGPGNLLGNLLCGIAGLLDGGLPLGDILGGLSTDDLNTVTSGLTSMLGSVFSQVTSSAAVQDAACDILNLSLGPVDLNLLGLDVELDNCDGGPVTVDITTEPGPGKLLGNLLCTVAHLLDGNASDVAVSRLLDRIAREIRRLI